MSSISPTTNSKIRLERDRKLRSPILLAGIVAAFSASTVLASAEMAAPATPPPFEILFGDVDNDSPSTMAIPESGPTVSVTFDGLSSKPRLNIGLSDTPRNLSEGDTITFETYWNYSAWIERAEVRIFEVKNAVGKPLAIVDVRDRGATWQVDTEDASEIFYVLRVYDAEGRFDETELKAFDVPGKRGWFTRSTPNAAADIYGEDATAVRNIKVWGGSLTVFGSGAAPGTQVEALGAPAPIDEAGAFVVQEIVPPGTHAAEWTVIAADGAQRKFSKQIEIPRSDWFLVGLGELTLLKRDSSGSALLSADGEFDKTTVTGRGAFYLKGKVKGDVLITASVDTTEGDIDDLASNLTEKSPQSFLNRLDPDRYYPVYGDDSTIQQDAPTQGRMYLRVERGDDHLIWGNFTTPASDTELSQVERALYGAKVGFISDQATKFGDSKGSFTAYAADPGTLPAREEFRGTGGSVYFLERQDLSVGSERVFIEVRDRESGLTVDRRELNPQEDYDIDYIQGRILLSRPLNSTRIGSSTVREGTISGDAAYLVVGYEYSPLLTDINDFTHGGRAEGWANDHLKIGLTAQDSEADEKSQQLIAADVTIRVNESTYVKVETAQTKGAGFGESASSDGGFRFSNTQAQASPNQRASAHHIEASSDLSAFASLGIDGEVSAYYGNLEQGFSSLGNITSEDTTRWGAAFSGDVTEDTNLEFKYDESDLGKRSSKQTAVLDIARQLSKNLSSSLGLRHSNRDSASGADSGKRTELGVELRYESDENWSSYGFVQDTIKATGSRKKRARYGVGGSSQITDSISLNGEVSDGDGGVGAVLGLTHKREDGSEYYANYSLNEGRGDTETSSSAFGSDSTLTIGGRHQHSDNLSFYGEERASFGSTEGITHAYGVDFSPREELEFGSSVEIGELEQGDERIERRAATVSAGYTRETISFSSALEWRIDETLSEKRRTLLMRNSLGLDLNPDWRGIAKLNFADSNSGSGSFFDGDFLEAQLAGAYRPVLNDRFNALFRLTYFRDLPPAGQLSGSGESGLPAQRSQIVNLDATYDLTNWLSIGGKYGYRHGEVSLSREEEDWVDSSTHLGILRADLHIVKQWDALLEGRMLKATAADDERSGYLVAVYRHFGNHAKVGLGYNFTDFSDDLTDFSYNERGLFLNVVSKF